MIDWKDLLSKPSSIVVWVIFLFIYLVNCDNKDGDKIITPEPTEEDNNQDPNIRSYYNES
jgi:hypothetical protein|tara:strand:- start:615 stop:794 length:180 start_codon:yes stop_codon:yes gene_type:complete